RSLFGIYAVCRFNFKKQSVRSGHVWTSGHGRLFSRCANWRASRLSAIPSRTDYGHPEKMVDGRYIGGTGMDRTRGPENAGRRLPGTPGARVGRARNRRAGTDADVSPGLFV